MQLILMTTSEDAITYLLGQVETLPLFLHFFAFHVFQLRHYSPFGHSLLIRASLAFEFSGKLLLMVSSNSQQFSTIPVTALLPT